MESAWTRSFLVASTTLAAASTQATRRAAPEACPTSPVFLDASCSASDEYVSFPHVMAPLALPCALQVFDTMPTLLLPSTFRARRLCAAAAQLVALWCCLVGTASVFAWVSRSLAYAVSLHASALFLVHADPHSVLIASAAQKAARWGGVALLIAGSMYLGPPLPVVGAPGLSGCCGAACHLAAWAGAETFGALFLVFVSLLRAH